jgi:hypothetical protein
MTPTTITFTVRAATIDHLDTVIADWAKAFFGEQDWHRISVSGTDRDSLGQYLFTVTLGELL